MKHAISALEITELDFWVTLIGELAQHASLQTIMEVAVPVVLRLGDYSESLENKLLAVSLTGPLAKAMKDEF
jgi:hypothetical protein